MKKSLSILFLAILALCARAEYAGVALPRESETGAGADYYDAFVAVDTLDASAFDFAVGRLASATSQELRGLLADPAQLGKAQKFLKMARLKKGTKLFAFKFGRYRVAVFEIASGSRMRKGLNYFVFDPIGEKMLWDLSVNDPYLALIAQCNFAAPKKIEPSKIAAFSASDKAKINDIVKRGDPVLVFANAALVSTDAVPAVGEEPAAKFYKKIQDVFFSWRIDEYAAYMSPKSRALFNAQYSGMDETRKKAVLSDYFSWKKKYLKVVRLSKSEYIIIFKRQKAGQKDQIDTAYITLESADGSRGKLEKFGVKTPLDHMMARYIFR